ncbi:MFS transporter [Egicoccus sp. AB-alg6-2]|uniref:MFS transporter n=1 Tax=Egicoccus sp. AB-alg6-2 TaxID=3242692 RepID=UPI00359CEAF7
MTLVGGVVLLISIGAFFRVPLLPSIGDELSMSPGQLGLITTVFALGRLVTDIPAGRMADRIPPLRSLGLAGAILAVGSIGVASAGAGVWVITAAFALGIASALANTTGMTFFSTAAPAAQRGTSMAVFSAALLGGQALGPMIGGAIGGAAGWRTAIASAAVVGLVVALLGAFSNRLPRPPQAAPGGGHHGVMPSGPDPTPRLQRWLLFSVAFSLFFMLGSMPQTLIPIIGDARYALTPGRIGLALGIGGACRFVGAMVGGRLADRLSRKISLIPGMALCTAGIAILAVDLGVAGWVASIVLLSLGSYGVSVSATMLADHAGGSGVGRRLGTYRFVGDVGLIAGPTLSGVLYERVSDTAAVLLVAGLVGAVTLLCALLLRETRWIDEHPTADVAGGNA